jgi:two-component system sensor kinase FixL
MSRSPVADALRTLELNEARWQAVLDTARDAIISIDTEGHITLFNQAAASIFGYTAEEVLGANVTVLMPSPYRDEHDQYLQNYQDTGMARAIGRIREVEARRKNGEVFPIELSVSEARIGDQVIYTAIIRDVSERSRTQAEIRMLEARVNTRERLADLGAITAKIVHDIGNPLAGLSMQAQLIMRRASRAETIAADTIRDPAAQIVATVGRLDALVKDFMDFAREQRLDLRAVLLPRLLQDTIDLWRPVAAARKIDLTLHANEPEEIRADEIQLKRVFDNLIKNAIEAIDQGPGLIDISMSGDENRIHICVQDSGPGFPPTLQGFRLFETTKPNGTGIGLAVVRQIVLAHGGEVDFRAAEPHGTIFDIDLPRTPPLT